MLTRDMARLAPRLDIFRLLHFYYSGLGYFITARVMMLGIYMQVWRLLKYGGGGSIDACTRFGQ